MEGQMSIYDFPEYLPNDDFETMTSKRASELVGERIGAKFQLFEKYFHDYFKAKKDGFEIMIGFSTDFDGKRFLDTEVDHGTSCYGTPAKSIDDCVDSIKRYIDKESRKEQKPNPKSAYEIFNEHCKHKGYHKHSTETEPSMWMCGFANRRLAKCWEDWIPCTEENCPLLKEE